MDMRGHMSFSCKAPAVGEEPMAYQLVGEVKAHQGDDE